MPENSYEYGCDYVNNLTAVYVTDYSVEMDACILIVLATSDEKFNSVMFC